MSEYTTEQLPTENSVDRVSTISSVEKQVFNNEVSDKFVVVKYTDGTSVSNIPVNPKNRFYQEALEWEASNSSNKIKTPVINLDSLKSQMISDLKSLRSSVESDLMSSISVNYLDTTFHADEVALMQLDKVYNAIILCKSKIADSKTSQEKKDEYTVTLQTLLPLLDESRYWTDKSGVTHVLTLAQLEHFYNKVKEIHTVNVAERGDQVYRTYFTLLQEIHNATSKTAINTVDFSSLEGLREMTISI